MVDSQALVGVATGDDAAVYRLSDEMAVVATVDYITPVVDDPYAWGTVAAANALSDVWAMGARALFGLNVVNFPRDTLPLTFLEQVIAGGAAKASEAGVPILGGHSIDDPEPKFGMVVVGVVHPDRLVRNVGAQPGDALILTKPLGVGILTTGIKRGLVSELATTTVVEVMATLNRAASEAMLESQGLHAATDVTGFGLLGHLAEMLGSGGVGVELDAAAIPVLDDTWDLVRRDVVPGGSQRNLAGVSEVVDWDPAIGPERQIVLADAQTSGGMLIAVAPDAADALLASLRRRGVRWATRIGTFNTSPGRIRVR